MQVKIKIEGRSPLLCNAFTDEAAMAATSGTRVSTIGDRGSPQEQAEKKLYKDEQGRCCIPVPNMFRCLIDGGIYFKSGRSKITTQKSSLIPACVEIEGVMLPIKHKDPWTVDTRPVRIPSTGGRILCHRPCFHDWTLEFEAEIDETMISPALFRDIVDAAGKRIGLGDFRPSCKGPFGRFQVTKWEVRDQKLKTAA